MRKKLVLAVEEALALIKTGIDLYGNPEGGTRRERMAIGKMAWGYDVVHNMQVRVLNRGDKLTVWADL